MECDRHISVVVDKNLDVELLGDMVKESGVDTHIIEEVKILSEERAVFGI